MKRVITAGKITTDHLTGQRVLWQCFDLDGHLESTPARCPRNSTGPMLRVAARRAEIRRGLRKQD